MSKNTLEVLFDSRPRIKILKFLFRNMGARFTVGDVSIRIQEPPGLVRKELKKLLEVGLITNKK